MGASEGAEDEGGPGGPQLERFTPVLARVLIEDAPPGAVLTLSSSVAASSRPRFRFWPVPAAWEVD